MSQIGLLILMGIVVNNGIVLLDHMNQLRNAGMATEEAILQAGRDRMRAIPDDGVDDDHRLGAAGVGWVEGGWSFYYPLAIMVMGVLISSAVLTLVALPYVNLLVEGVAGWMRRMWEVSGVVGGRRSVEAVEVVEAVP